MFWKSWNECVSWIFSRGHFSLFCDRTKSRAFALMRRGRGFREMLILSVTCRDSWIPADIRYTFVFYWRTKSPTSWMPCRGSAEKHHIYIFGWTVPLRMFIYFGWIRDKQNLRFFFSSEKDLKCSLGWQLISFQILKLAHKKKTCIKKLNLWALFDRFYGAGFQLVIILEQ